VARAVLYLMIVASRQRRLRTGPSRTLQAGAYCPAALSSSRARNRLASQADREPPRSARIRLRSAMYSHQASRRPLGLVDGRHEGLKPGRVLQPRRSRSDRHRDGWSSDDCLGVGSWPRVGLVRGAPEAGRARMFGREGGRSRRGLGGRFAGRRVDAGIPGCVGEGYTTSRGMWREFVDKRPATALSYPAEPYTLCRDFARST
jgi:hypothetical protein